MQAFGHDVHKLMRGWDLKDTNLPQSKLLMNKVDVDLDMLHAVMMDRIGHHIDNTHIVVATEYSSLRN